MKIWIGDSSKVFCSTGAVCLPNTGELRCDKSDAFPFLFSQNLRRVIIGTSKNIHHDLWPGEWFGYNFIAGRFWTEERIITFYDNALNPFPASDMLSEIIDDIKDVSGIDILNYNVIKKIGVLDINVNAIAEIPAKEYISMSLTGDEYLADFKSICGTKDIIDTRNNNWKEKEHPTKVLNKVDRFPGDDNYSKLQNMRTWNGHEVAESKTKKKVIVNESQLRVILNEIASVEIDKRTKDL